MRIVVVDPDEETAASLDRQLTALGYDVATTADLRPALDICEHTLPELVCCADLNWAKALAAAQRRLPVVYTPHQSVDPEEVLEALRSGLADAWPLPQDRDFLESRVNEILDRGRAAQSQAEARLNEHLVELERDQRAGRYIQLGMLPPNPMAIEQYRLRHRILPSLILSGDFVDYFRITDRHFAFYIADVSGHGASSAFVTVLLKNFSRRLRREYRPSMLVQPGEILVWINRELLEQRIDKHVAMIFGIGDLSENTIRVVNAGHFPPIVHAGRDFDPRFVEQRGKPVGLFEEVSYESLTISMAVGDRLCMFSDGVLQAMTESKLEDKEARLLRAARHTKMDNIWQALAVHTSTAPDDMTCLTVRRDS
ncbi:MAG: SpoIIE family protein phosphatase [Acidobacteriota bacterium]|jgi:sigma-B regulation protein RsbU (phosphoserine phosphatase)